MRVLLVGQPNCGKTTLFNRLTGRQERTGNRAGVTVRCARGRLRGRPDVELVDLPGLYGFSGGGEDEGAARRAIEEEKPDLIVNVLDGTALVRGLTLTLQLASLGTPMLLLLNMVDEVRQQGICVEKGPLSRALGVPVHSISAKTGEGLDVLPRLLVQGGRTPRVVPAGNSEQLYRTARALADAALFRRGSPRRQGADRLLLHPLWGLPVLGLVLGSVFCITFQWVGPYLSRGVSYAMEALQRTMIGTVFDRPFLREGVVESMGYVLSFLPMILVLSLLLSLLEDVGYLPRAAFLLDGWLRRLGLDGRSAVPLLLGLGCTVPAILSTCSMADRSLRRGTVRFLPYVPCSARLPFLLLLGSRLLPRRPALGALLFYGISLAVGLTDAAFRREPNGGAFYLELPPLRLPRGQSVLRQTLQHVEQFLLRAGRILLPASLALWFALHLSVSLHPIRAGEESLLSALGRLLLPLLRWVGLDDWRAGVILLSGIGAKETMAASAALFLKDGLTLTFSETLILGVMATLLPPCLGTLSTAGSELGRPFLWRLVLRHLLIAWGVGFLLHVLLHLFGA